MSKGLDGLKQLVQIADPKTFKRLKNAGVVGDPKGVIGIAKSLPWLIGRGPSLGVVSKMHSFTLADKPAIHDKHGTLTWKGLDERAQSRRTHAHEPRAERQGPSGTRAS